MGGEPGEKSIRRMGSGAMKSGKPLTRGELEEALRRAENREFFYKLREDPKEMEIVISLSLLLANGESA